MYFGFASSVLALLLVEFQDFCSADGQKRERRLLNNDKAEESKKQTPKEKRRALFEKYHTLKRHDTVDATKTAPKQELRASAGVEDVHDAGILSSAAAEAVAKETDSLRNLGYYYYGKKGGKSKGKSKGKKGVKYSFGKGAAPSHKYTPSPTPAPTKKAKYTPRPTLLPTKKNGDGSAVTSPPITSPPIIDDSTPSPTSSPTVKPTEVTIDDPDLGGTEVPPITVPEGIMAQCDIDVTRESFCGDTYAYAYWYQSNVTQPYTYCACEDIFVEYGSDTVPFAEGYCPDSVGQGNVCCAFMCIYHKCGETATGGACGAFTSSSLEDSGIGQGNLDPSI